MNEKQTGLPKLYRCFDCGHDISTAETPGGRPIEVLSVPSLVYLRLSGSYLWTNAHQTHAAVCPIHYARQCRMGSAPKDVRDEIHLPR